MNTELILIIYPPPFSPFRYLRVLKLGFNHFESIPHELGDVTALRQLELPGNRLWHLPYSIQNLKNLRCLNLAENSFEQLPITVW